ncbi:C-C motif chemokine 18-like [Silurus meridionalis]|uniref:C-C motif chemokine 18-like n=1 Tax=Silurus meridionalis TaxID=175797 RepID=UPI001EEB7606|nr:C-C motif chemokine 18-like [Silurus meridionalis]
MISRGLLLVLLVLTCLQSFKTAQNGNGPDSCCFSYQRTPIPIRVITGYKVTDPQCPKPAVIFTLKKDNRQVCVDPDLKWVQKHMKIIDQILNKTSTSTSSSPSNFSLQ